MAESSSDKSKQKIVTACQLNLTAIITALHENALSKVTDKDVRIANSAVSKDGKLKSAGEHIIAAMSAKGEDERITKAQAVKSLQEYCAWFVGPDLAKKISDKNVQPLGNDQNVSESRRFKSFIQYIVEAEDDSTEAFVSPDERNEDGTEKEYKSDLIQKDDSIDPANTDFNDGQSDDLDKAKAAEDAKQEGGVGYYITYNLKVEGMKQAALADAMKDFAATFFDNVKITASGLFGGGSSFTIKDVKDALKDAFGPIDDPDTLVSNIESNFKKKFPKVGNDFNVEVRDKTTLDQEIKNFDVDAQARKQVQSADYSLTISIKHDDAYSKIVDKRSIADLVTSSIKGIFKKFKYSVSANDVVLVQNFTDTESDRLKVQKLNSSVPKIEELRKIIPDNIDNDKKKASQILSKLNSEFEKLKNNSMFSDSKLASRMYSFWNNKNNDKSWYKVLSDDLSDDKNWKSRFESDIAKFLHDYEDKYKKESNDLSESYSSLTVKDMILEQLFADYSSMKSILNDADDEQEQNLSDINKKLKSDAEDLMILNIPNKNWQHSANTFAGTPDKVIGYLDRFKFDTDFDFKKLNDSKYAAVVVVKIPMTVDDNTYNGSIGNANFTDDAVKKLFAGVISGQFTYDQFIGHSKKYVYNKSKQLADYKVFIAEFNDPKLNTGNEENDSQSENSVDFTDTGSDEHFQSSAGDDDDQAGKDLYIVPMPGMKFKSNEENA